ncbi:MAG: hypothetical protein DMG78_01980 [Acidobacteria bacterium]|nr:MAG: hypothetical protein DMG78_01980 [Acidobacteriota bacterium]
MAALAIMFKSDKIVGDSNQMIQIKLLLQAAVLDHGQAFRIIQLCLIVDSWMHEGKGSAGSVLWGCR